MHMLTLLGVTQVCGYEEYGADVGNVESGYVSEPVIGIQSVTAQR